MPGKRRVTPSLLARLTFLRLRTPTRWKRHDRLSGSVSRAIRFLPRRTVATIEPRQPCAALTPGGRPSLPSRVMRTRPRLIRFAFPAFLGRRPLSLAAGVTGGGPGVPIGTAAGGAGSTGASGPMPAIRTSAVAPELPVSHATTPT